MALFHSTTLLPTPALNLLPLAPPTPPRHGRSFQPAASAASSRYPPRQPYRRRRDGPASRPPPAPTPRRPTSPPPPPPPPPPPQQQRPPANAAASGPQEDQLEEAIHDFMRRSAKPGAFPTSEELVAAGRADLAAAVASSGGWLALGWSFPSSSRAASTASNAAPVSSGAGRSDGTPPRSGLYDRNIAPGAGDDAGREEEDDEASPSVRPQETEVPREVRFKAGIEGMLTRLQMDRERARPHPRSSSRGRGGGDNGGMLSFSSTRLPLRLTPTWDRNEEGNAKSITTRYPSVSNGRPRVATHFL